MKHGKWVLFPVLCILMSSCDKSENPNIGHKTVKYIYSVEVVALGPADLAKNPVTLKSSAGTVTLQGQRCIHTQTIPWTYAYPKIPGLHINQRDFIFNVEVQKDGYESWQTTYMNGDFFFESEGVARRIDRIELYQIPENLPPTALRQLDQTLPCGLNIYTIRGFRDINSDGFMDVFLYRRANPTSSQSKFVEVRVLSYHDGQWSSVFTANHTGIYLSGSKVPEIPTAEYGYSFKALGRSSADFVFELTDLCPLSPDGKPLKQYQRTYGWPKGETNFTFKKISSPSPDKK